MLQRNGQNLYEYQEATNHASQTATTQYDVAVIGAGIAGLSACIFLRQTGLRVVCIEPKPFPHDSVGESLDWSAPALLQKLGISRDELVAEQVATYKYGLTAYSFDKLLFRSDLCPSISNWPLRFETQTCHVDRVYLDQKLFEIAQNMEVTFICHSR